MPTGQPAHSGLLSTGKPQKDTGLREHSEPDSPSSLFCGTSNTVSHHTPWIILLPQVPLCKFGHPYPKLYEDLTIWIHLAFFPCKEEIPCYSPPGFTSKSTQKCLGMWHVNSWVKLKLLSPSFIPNRWVGAIRWQEAMPSNLAFFPPWFNWDL